MKSNDVLLARWFALNKNFGDALNPYIIEELSHRRPINLQHGMRSWRVRQLVSPWPRPEYMVVGSILGRGFRRPGVNVCWGPGFMYEDEAVRSRPRKVCAVRGPLSREKLLAQGIECPDVFGDPALLMPRFYSPKVEPKYELGVIPHYWDKSLPWFETVNDDPNVLVIDVFWDVEKVVDAILSCRRIASSSLHGVIFADAYGVPSRWVAFAGSDVPMMNFKFRDYFGSVNRPETEPFLVAADLPVSGILDDFTEPEVVLPDLDRLLDACPFRA